jgi:hypothetical protein
VVVDETAVLPGRGAWVHPRTDCVEKARTRKAFGRALRITQALDTSPVSEFLERASNRETIRTDSVPTEQAERTP